jgi:hypothetical protein
MSAKAEKTVETPTANAAPVAVPLKRPLRETQFKLASFVTNRWAVVLPIEVEYDRVFDPEFWANVASRIRPSDIIEVHSEAMDFYAELYVMRSKRLAVDVVELSKIKLERKAAQEAVTDLYVKNMGPLRKFCIMRGKDVVADGYVNEGDAILAIGARSREALR